MKVLLIAVTILAVAAAQNYPDNGGQQSYGPGSGPSPAGYPQPVYNYAPRPYSFAYEVKDPQSYNDYGHQESSDGKTVTGSYRVALPDGRLQLVNYKADGYGYVADVQYQGEPRFPEYRPQQQYAAAAAGLAYPAGPISGPGPVRGGFDPAGAGADGQNY